MITKFLLMWGVSAVAAHLAIGFVVWDVWWFTDIQLWHSAGRLIYLLFHLLIFIVSGIVLSEIEEE